jgi:signal transduction histidine kinase
MTETIIISEEDEDKRRFLKQIYDSANRLLEMINDILDLSKLENKSIPIQKKKIDIKKFLYDYIAGIKIQADSQKLKTLAIIENDVPKTITVDKTKLMQILNNLFGNALKYTKKGEIGLRVSRNKNKIVFSIFDSGVGIPKKDLEKVFERFYQVDSSNRKKHKGTGLGLSIVKSLVEIMGGTISVYSSEGKGTCFKFSIPIT